MELMYILTGAAVLASFLLTLLVGRFVLMELRKLKAGQEIREDGPKWHAGKAGTPTMGGIMFILGAGVVVFLLGWGPMLQGEAMAQCGGLLVLSQLEEPERWSTYFLKIDDVKFRDKVVPGDTLLFKVELLHPVRHGISSMKGYVFVGDHVVSEATFTAQIKKNR